MRANSIFHACRIANARDSKEECMKKKFNHEVDFIELEGQNAFTIEKVILLLMKCTHTCDYCKLREKMMIGAECLC